VGQASEEDADHCETDKRRVLRVALEVAGEAPVLSMLQFEPPVTRVLRGR
jgi:hypothetical protein